MDPAPFLSCRALGCAEEERKQPEHSKLPGAWLCGGGAQATRALLYSYCARARKVGSQADRDERRAKAAVANHRVVVSCGELRRLSTCYAAVVLLLV